MTTHTAVGEPPNHGTKITENIYSSSLKQERRARRGSLRGRCPELRGFTCCNQHVLKPLSPLTHQQRVVLLGYFSRTVSQLTECFLAGTSNQHLSTMLCLLTVTVTALALHTQKKRYISTPILMKWKWGQLIDVDKCIEQYNLLSRTSLFLLAFFSTVSF